MTHKSNPRVRETSSRIGANACRIARPRACWASVPLRVFDVDANSRTLPVCKPAHRRPARRKVSEGYVTSRRAPHRAGPSPGYGFLSETPVAKALRHAGSWSWGLTPGDRRHGFAGPAQSLMEKRGALNGYHGRTPGAGYYE